MEAIIVQNCTITGLSWSEYQRKKKRGGKRLLRISAAIGMANLGLRGTLCVPQSSARRNLSMTRCISACSSIRTTCSTRERLTPGNGSTRQHEQHRFVQSGSARAG